MEFDINKLSTGEWVGVYNGRSVRGNSYAEVLIKLDIIKNQEDEED